MLREIIIVRTAVVGREGKRKERKKRKIQMNKQKN